MFIKRVFVRLRGEQSTDSERREHGAYTLHLQLFNADDVMLAAVDDLKFNVTGDAPETVK